VQRFDRNDDRLRDFLGAIWKTLVPSTGECASLQGELVRADARLSDESYRNGLGNYYHPDQETDGFAEGFYPKMLVFLLETLAANANDANDADTVAYCADALARAPLDWEKQRRIIAIVERAEEDENRELSDAENAEIETLEAAPERLDWEDLLNRTEIAVGNYCLANPVLVDLAGKPIEEGGVTDIRHIFDPPPPPPPCPLCNGKGWVAPADPTQFPTMCSCKTATVLH
jgi:hypothetical protein